MAEQQDRTTDVFAFVEGVAAVNGALDVLQAWTSSLSEQIAALLAKLEGRQVA